MRTPFRLTPEQPLPLEMSEDRENGRIGKARIQPIANLRDRSTFVLPEQGHYIELTATE